jgi:penicillin amidase
VARKHAWTLTSGYSDNTDITVEVLNPANPGQYLFRGEFLDFDCRPETIVVAGAPDVTTEVCESVHGPVLGTAPGIALTRKTITRGVEGRTIEMFLDFSRAKSIGEFRDAVSKQAYSFNVLYADTAGNIAHFHLGTVPIRADGDDPWLLHDGTGSAEWQGMIPFDEMPQSINPDQGWLVNWNNKPGPVWPNASGGQGMHGPVQRVNTLLNLLGGLQPGTATLQTLEDFNRTAGFTASSPSGQARPVVVTTLRDELLARVDTGADPRLPDITALVSGWNMLQEDEDADGFYDDSPAGLVFNTWWAAAVERIFADDLGSALQQNIVANMMYRLIAPDPALPLQHDYLGGETVEGALTAALITALDQLEVDFGSTNVADWQQPISEIRHRPNGLATVPNTIWMNRGTYNQLVHLGRGPGLFAENVVAPGQSGVAGDPHVDDQLELYATWSYKRMVLGDDDLGGNVESVTELHP